MKRRIFRSWRFGVAALEVFIVLLLIKGPMAAAEDDADGNPAAASLSTNPAPQQISGAAIAGATLSSSAAGVVKLAQAGLGDDVLLAYIAASKTAFSLGSEQIVYLNDLGISSISVKAMIQRDAAINEANAAALAVTNMPPPFDPGAPLPPGADSTAPPPPADDYGPGAYGNPPADYPSDYATGDDASYFYDSLAPFGSWGYYAGVGYCWQPSVYSVDHGWRPYQDRGRWIYTDSGWYWQSDYSWGWGPFHYGRWFRDKAHGWVWAPNRTWAPAWVSWRVSNEYCGWAPLPPAARFVPGVGFRYGNNFVGGNFDFGLTANRYIFIPLERMVATDPSRYSLLPAQAAAAFGSSVVANNYSVENNRVTSSGLDPKLVSRVAGSQVIPAEIKELKREAGKNSIVEHLAKQDGKLMIYSPALPKPDPDSARKISADIFHDSSSRGTAVIAANNGANYRSSSEPIVLGQPSGAPEQYQEHKPFVLMVPAEKHFELSPAGAGRPPGVAGDTSYDPRRGEVAPDHPVRSSPIFGDVRTPNNAGAPQYYYPQSGVLIPSHYQTRNGSGERSGPYYPGQENNRSEAPAHSPIAIPPAYSHVESAPAPAYHPPVESHPAPPPAESHSGSSSSSSSSPGHK